MNETVELKDGDEVIVDNISLLFKDGKFIMKDNSLAFANIYKADTETGEDCEIECKLTDGKAVACYKKDTLNHIPRVTTMS